MRSYVFWDFKLDFKFLVKTLNPLTEVLNEKVPVKQT